AEGVKRFAVALLEEGIVLREAGIAGEILVLGALSPEQAGEVAERRFEAALSDMAFARRLDEEARRRGWRVGVHLKFDTGMGRLGFPASRALEAAAGVARLPGLRLAGAMTHFPSADEAAGADFTRGQVR